MKPITTHLSKALSHPATEYIVLLGVTLVATLLRLYNLSTWSFWIDEVITWHRAQAALDAGIAGIFSTPISTQLIGAMLTFGPVTEWSTRIVPAVAGIVSIPILYFPFRRLFGVAPALIAVILIALSPWHLYWSQNVRFYTILMLFYTLAALCFYIGFEERRPWYLLAFVVLSILAVRERISAFYLIPIIVSYIIAARIWFNKGNSTISLRYVLPLLAMPVLGYSLYEFVGAQFFGRHSSMAHFVTTFIGSAHAGGTFSLILELVARLGIPMLCIGTIGAVYMLLTQWDRKTLYLLLVVGVPLAIILFLSPFTLVNDRYYIFAALPFWAILCGTAIYAMFSQLGRYGPLFATGLLALFIADGSAQSFLYHQYLNGDRPDYRGAYEIVMERGGADDVVVTSHHQVLIAQYYMKRTVEEVYKVDLDELVSRGQPIWFVIEPVAGPVPSELLNWINEHATLIDERSLSTPGKNDILQVHLYDGREALQAHSANR